VLALDRPSLNLRLFERTRCEPLGEKIASTISGTADTTDAVEVNRF
jgi:hypothetical protein